MRYDFLAEKKICFSIWKTETDWAKKLHEPVETKKYNQAEKDF